MDAVLSCLVEDSLGPASAAQEFQEKLSAHFGRSTTLTLREPRRGVELLFQALGVNTDTRLVLSPLLPRVYWDVARSLDAVPELVDVREDATLRVEEAASRDPDVLVLDAPLGHAPDVGAAAELGLQLVEDVSSGLGLQFEDRLFGGYGSYSILFLEPEYLITAGGGVAVSGRGRKEKQTLTSHARKLPRASRMTDVNSALGLTQLRSLQTFIDRRRRIADHYAGMVARSRHGTVPHSRFAGSVPFAFPVVVDSNVKEAVEYAKKKRVELVCAFEGSILDALLAERAENDSADPRSSIPVDLDALPTAERLVRRCLAAPLYPMLTSEQIETVGRVLATLP
jgi:dTDP-4-amino-4,6-dideoxygalactose transaminase